ncbi:hypothetical protein GPALN_011664 [Globodera pallida]|nr:hypothetical protein GPALN_011664 [Globodera pallida]
MEEPDEYEEMVAVLQLDGVLDFEAIRRAVSANAIRVRECDKEAPIVQIGSHLYVGKWTQTLGTDMLFCTTMLDEYHHPAEQPGQQRLELVAMSDTRLCAQKVLLATDESSNNATQSRNEQSSSSNVLSLEMKCQR